MEFQQKQGAQETVLKTEKMCACIIAVTFMFYCEGGNV